MSKIITSLTNEPNNMNCIGYWDTRKSNFSLGKILIFLKEIEEFVLCNKFHSFSIVVYGDKNPICEIFKLSKYFNTLEFIEITTPLDIEVLQDSTLVYKADKFENNSFTESTLYLQHKVQLNGYLISAGWTIPLDIKNIIKRITQNKHNIITIHLKNVKDTLSNANLIEWQKAVKYIITKNDNNKVFIIGNDLNESQYQLFDFQNVVITKTLKEKSLLLDLSLILSSNIFMGMSSGPCNVAIFSDIPYVVFKHPEHHTEEMKQEMNEDKKFMFQKNNQYFLLEYDTFEMLKKYFDLIENG
jgi:hypothetical protein